MIKHKHHIIPKHVGGSDDPSNLIELTIEEHAEAHRVLWETYGRPEDKLAWKALSGMLSKQEIISEVCKIGGSKGGKIGGARSKGRKQSNEWVAKRKVFGERNGMYGKHHSIEHKLIVGDKIRQQIDEDWQGTKNLVDSVQQRMLDGTHPSCKIWTCEYCGKTGKALGNYHRYHGINCKEYTRQAVSNQC